MTSVPHLVRMLGRRGALDRSGVVDEDVRRALLREDLRGERLHLGAVGEIALVGGELAAERLDRLFDLAVRLERGAHADDVRARLGERFGHRESDAALATGYQGGLPRQVECGKNAHRRVEISTLSMSVNAWFSPPIAHTKR
ncbi:hypothetical protein HNR46_003701 [Haloferula luteola]|uniref:Uncharacterized protein n=1 Tax=Haloferula luteola TaxID=595692 RepID=A0A840VHY1_9BACT|nr:hypothetical protein [Haloferula luteola]